MLLTKPNQHSFPLRNEPSNICFPESVSPKITPNPDKTGKSWRTIPLPVPFPNGARHSLRVSSPCAARRRRSVGGSGWEAAVWEVAWHSRGEGGWGESSLRLSTLDTSAGSGHRPGRPRGPAASPSPLSRVCRSPQLTSLLPVVESQRPTSGGTRRHDWVCPRHITTLTPRDPRACLGFRERRGNHSGNPKPFLWSHSVAGVPVATETGLSVTSLPPGCLDFRLLRRKLSNSHDCGRERLRCAHAPAQRPASIYVGDPTWRPRRPWRWWRSPSERCSGDRDPVRTHGGVRGDG